MPDDIILKYYQALDKLERFKSVSNCIEMDLVYDLIKGGQCTATTVVVIIASNSTIVINTINTICYLFDQLDSVLYGNIKRRNKYDYLISYLNCRIIGSPITHSLRGSTANELVLVDFENFQAHEINEIRQYFHVGAVNMEGMIIRYGY